MTESSDEPPIARIGIWDRVKAYASNLNSSASSDRAGHDRDSSILPVASPSSTKKATRQEQHDGHHRQHTSSATDAQLQSPEPKSSTIQGRHDFETRSASGPVPVDTLDGEKVPAVESKPSVFRRFWITMKLVVMSSYVNWLLLFVPVGIVLGAMDRSLGDRSPVSPTVVFVLNAIAIIPLAWMLGYATECVASNMGDTIGALLNVTFGNAVELIIFIALVANQIAIVQASLLGSILANLLLILGMCFLVGGLRFREQLYNSAVTQMSACLLSLSVISLLLPTAFHASFSTTKAADAAVIQVSRGTSVVLLLVYILYLLFQLKSHAYIYKSTPQHMIDEESFPGVLADILNSSTSSDASGDDDSDASSGSNTTVQRIRKALRKTRRRKSSSASKETSSVPSPSSFVRTASASSQVLDGQFATHAIDHLPRTRTESEPHGEATAAGQAASVARGFHPSLEVTSRDFEMDQASPGPGDPTRKATRKSHRWSKHRGSRKGPKYRGEYDDEEPSIAATTSSPEEVPFQKDSIPEHSPSSSDPQKRGFTIRNLAHNPALTRVLTSSVFSPAAQQELPDLPTTAAADKPQNQGLRRTNSLPDRLNGQTVATAIPSAQPLPHLVSKKRIEAKDDNDEKPKLSRTSAMVLLLVTTGLVAACAEFLVNSIDYLVQTTGISQAFIGLIILPIVGNAAEHVTAVTVASKNKMDLAIGVALGSSIQIALFVTPVIVLLGWILNTDMSLYFSLFETISLFASAFIVNYLMLDGRTNYLEGALLIAAYVIIAVAAFFYPSCEDTSTINGGPTNGSCR